MLRRQTQDIGITIITIITIREFWPRYAPVCGAHLSLRLINADPFIVNASPEYVILDDFNSTPGTLYPRYSITLGRILPQV